MTIEALRQQIQEHNGDLRDAVITMDSLTTNEQIDAVLDVLANKDLHLGTLGIPVNNEVAEYFVTQLKAMNPKPTIGTFKLPTLHLSHAGWSSFFDALSGMNIELLDLENSNFDYANDLPALGAYLALNPQLDGISLCHDNKVEDKTYYSGQNAKDLLRYLNTNTHLREIKYGHSFDGVLSSNLSLAIQAKLLENSMRDQDARITAQNIETFQKKGFVATRRKVMEALILADINESLKKGTDEEKSISRDVYGMPLNRKQLVVGLCRLEENLISASCDQNFKNSALYGQLEALIKQYQVQLHLLIAMDDLHRREVQASSHDKPILHNFRDDLLKEWKKIAAMEDSKATHEAMKSFIETKKQECQTAMDRVTDKSSYAGLKNTLLILSAVFSGGLALLIYAACTTKSRAECGHFFFRNAEPSKEKLSNVHRRLDEVDTELQKPFELA